MNRTECQKTLSGKHAFEKTKPWNHLQCRYCGMVDDIKKVDGSPIKIKRNKAEEERILGKKAK